MVNDTNLTNILAIIVGSDLILPSDTICNLVVFDSNIHMNKQVNSIVKSSFMSLRDMYEVKDCLPMDAKTDYDTFITSRLDYCNSTLYGVPKKHTSKHQGIQNTAAHLITDTCKYDHITPILRASLAPHW